MLPVVPLVTDSLKVSVILEFGDALLLLSAGEDETKCGGWPSPMFQAKASPRP